MKITFLFIGFLSLFSFSRQNIQIENKLVNTCKDFNDEDFVPDDKNSYGFNAQNCRLRDDPKNNSYRCCYFSIRYNNTDINFCSKVIDSIYKNTKDFIPLIKKTIENSIYSTILKDNNKISVDCFRFKTNYSKKIFLLLGFILFI